MHNTKSQLFKIPDFDLDTISLQGKGLKKLLVICYIEDFSDLEKTTLQKMMAAIKYDFESDIFLLTIEKKQDMILSSLDLDYTDLLIFGIKPENLGFNIESKLYEILLFDDKRVLVAESLSEIKSTQPKGQLLWNRLQTMFLHAK